MQGRLWKGVRMTEVEIMNDMLICIHGDCDNCTRQNEKNCRCELMEDARTAMKMQFNLLEKRRNEMENLAEQNLALQRMISHRYKEEDLVKAVNKIIEDSYDAGDCGDYFGNMVQSVQDFVKLTKLDGGVVVFGAASCYPQIQQIKTKCL